LTFYSRIAIFIPDSHYVPISQSTFRNIYGGHSIGLNAGNYHLLSVIGEIMRTSNRLWRAPVRLLVGLSIVVLTITGCSDATDDPVSVQPQYDAPVLSKDNPGIRRAMEAQNKHTESLMTLDDVVGTGTGTDEEGNPVVVVFKGRGKNADMPSVLEGIHVQQRVVGELVAFQYNPNARGGKPGKPGGGSGGGGKIDPKARFARPVPIGVSTGNNSECASGTIGCRVIVNGNYYMLTNNHVAARENAASPGESMVQPGRYDVSCANNAADIMATLTTFKPMVFSTSASNTIDAAICETSAAELGKSTPSNGYGTPSSTTVTPALNMKVLKYGRTTGQTKGTITAINATVNIGYSSGTARFVGQFVVQARKTFSRGGDSGSLIVTDDSNLNPCGLLFAGSSTTTICNPISLVLAEFGATIDGN
jgi:hypothetical protein